MQCPICGRKYNDPEDQEYIEKYGMCPKCDNEGTDEEIYEED